MDKTFPHSLLPSLLLPAGHVLQLSWFEPLLYTSNR